MENLELNVKEKIGQMLIIALHEKEITEETINIIQKYKIGGVILYRRDYDNYSEMLEKINKLKSINRENPIPLFISIDQEGGRVNRIPYEIKNIKSANKIANTQDIDIVKQSAEIISKILKSFGICMNYAPVLDIKRFDEDHAIGDRCFGGNKEDVFKYGVEFMKEMSKQGVLPVVKHFPGHGSTTKDSHISLPVVRKSKKELEKDDMYPFEEAIKNGADGIMVGHILIKDIDKKYPASLSKEIIHKYLIEKLKYKGLIITDDLKMLAVRLRYSPTKAVELAIKAGNDMVMTGLSYKTIERIINHIAKKVQKGKISETAINKSVDKIIKMKQKYNVNDNKVTGIDIEKINKEIEELNNKIENLSK